MSAASLPPWPNVPACHGWLALDARGQWRLKGERIEHGGLRTFLNANYAFDETGNWLVHNGPQRVYVDLESAPWVLRLLPDGTLQTHTGHEARASGDVLMDEHGHVFLPTTLGPAAIDDRDLAEFVAELRHAGSEVGVAEDTLLGLLEGRDDVSLAWRGHAVRFAPNDEIPARMGFNRVATEGDSHGSAAREC